MTGALDMEAVARACGYSWERFRKVWRALPGFPAPIKRPSLSGKGTYAWAAEAVQAWTAARQRALSDGYAADVRAANDADVAQPRRAHISAVQRQRADALRRLAGGR